MYPNPFGAEIGSSSGWFASESFRQRGKENSLKDLETKIKEFEQSNEELRSRFKYLEEKFRERDAETKAHINNLDEKIREREEKQEIINELEKRISCTEQEDVQMKAQRIQLTRLQLIIPSHRRYTSPFLKLKIYAQRLWWIDMILLDFLCFGFLEILNLRSSPPRISHRHLRSTDGHLLITNIFYGKEDL
ncbi:13613_t:CDS:2 [Funneliformis mosseae]|uniref:13613_t:CDS:1 n=1 Tax=Funneliformis mosseae TaxID=27381 RepID=A0A9N8WJ69_FUNMO|nr:13613_t:CDS:2 [Funneliformis mosseae]